MLLLFSGCGNNALPFGEGAPEGGGRGAVQCAILLLPCGEFVLRQHLFRLFQCP